MSFPAVPASTSSERWLPNLQILTHQESSYDSYIWRLIGCPLLTIHFGVSAPFTETPNFKKKNSIRLKEINPAGPRPAVGG
jgi:hypothetical protein